MPNFITYSMYNPANVGLFSLPWHEEDKTMTLATLPQTSALAAPSDAEGKWPESRSSVLTRRHRIQ